MIETAAIAATCLFCAALFGLGFPPDDLDGGSPQW